MFLINEIPKETIQELKIKSYNMNYKRNSIDSENIRMIKHKRFDSSNLNRTSLGNTDNLLSQEYRQRHNYRNSNILSLKENNSEYIDNSFKSENIVKDVNKKYTNNVYYNEFRNKSENIDSGRISENFLEIINSKYFHRSYDKFKLELN